MSTFANHARRAQRSGLLAGARASMGGAAPLAGAAPGPEPLGAAPSVRFATSGAQYGVPARNRDCRSGVDLRDNAKLKAWNQVNDLYLRDLQEAFADWPIIVRDARGQLAWYIPKSSGKPPQTARGVAPDPVICVQRGADMWRNGFLMATEDGSLRISPWIWYMVGGSSRTYDETLKAQKKSDRQRARGQVSTCGWARNLTPEQAVSLVANRTQGFTPTAWDCLTAWAAESAKPEPGGPGAFIPPMPGKVPCPAGFELRLWPPGEAPCSEGQTLEVHAPSGCSRCVPGVPECPEGYTMPAPGDLVQPCPEGTVFEESLDVPRCQRCVPTEEEEGKGTGALVLVGLTAAALLLGAMGGGGE